MQGFVRGVLLDGWHPVLLVSQMDARFLRVVGTGTAPGIACRVSGLSAAGGLAARAGATPRGRAGAAPRLRRGGGIPPALGFLPAPFWRHNAPPVPSPVGASSSERPRPQPHDATRHFAPLRRRTSSCGECGKGKGAKPPLERWPHLWPPTQIFGNPSGLQTGTLRITVQKELDQMRHVRPARWIVAGCVGAVSIIAQDRSPRYTIAFKAVPPSNTDIFVAAGDGSNTRALAQDPALDYNASVSADGSWIVFTSHRAGSADLYRVRPDGTGLERLTDDPAFDDQAAFSPDGTRLAFVSTRRGQADIWTLDLETRQTHLVIGDSAGDFRPAWSPDGQWIAFSSDREPATKSCPPTAEPGPGPFVTPHTPVSSPHGPTEPASAASPLIRKTSAGLAGPPTDPT